MKRWIAILTACLLLTGFASSPVALAAPGGKTFKFPPGQIKKLFVDSEEAPWAATTIEKMGHLGLMSGYPGGKFLPNKPVTQLEALSMAVRVFDWLTTTDQDAGLKAIAEARGTPAWGIGCVITAIQKGILSVDLENFQPNKPATRAQVAELIVKALEAAGEEEGNRDFSDLKDYVEGWSENGSIWFTDAGDIPERYREYVRVIACLGIMKGNPDGSFAPDKPVTRAQMAALLYRLRLMIAGSDDLSATETLGYIIGKDMDGDTIILWTSLDRPLEINLAEAREISRNNNELEEDEWDQLEIGDRVIVEKEDDAIVRVSARTFYGKVEFEGEITDIDADEITVKIEYGTLERELTYTLDNDVDTDAFAEGDDVTIVLQQGEVIDID